ncbi:glycosyltransferase, partial [Clostridium perfringens]
MIYISIIVPVYNSEKYIDRCIESLLNQTLKNIEIIIINDGSTDKSEEIIKYYSKSDKRVVLINKKNGGVSSARNLGIEKANGKYISFVDSDDWCNLDMFEILYNNAEKYNSDLTNIGYFLDNKNGVCKLKECFDKNVFSKDKDEIAEILNELPMGYSVLKLYRRDLLKNIRFNENINFGEDAIFVLDYIKQIKSISVINKCSYHYVKCNNESLSKRYVYNIEEFINEFWNKEEEVYLKFPKYRELRNKKGFNREVNGSIL